MGPYQQPAAQNVPNAGGHACHNAQQQRQAQYQRPAGQAPPHAPPEQPVRPEAGVNNTPTRAPQMAARLDDASQSGMETFGCGRGGYGLVRGGAAAGRGVNAATVEPGLPWGMR